MNPCTPSGSATASEVSEQPGHAYILILTDRMEIHLDMYLIQICPWKAMRWLWSDWPDAHAVLSKYLFLRLHPCAHSVHRPRAP